MAIGRRRTTRRKTTTRRRRRRVSGFGKAETQRIAGLVIGSIGAKFLDQVPGYSSLDARIQSIIKVGVGVAGTSFGKNDILKGVSDALIANGAADLAADFGVVSGIGKYLPMSGVGQDVPTINSVGAGLLNELQGATMTFSEQDVPTIAGLGFLD